MSKIIYHYCSADTFGKILDSKAMFLTSTAVMNDTMEVLWFKQIFYNEIKKYNTTEYSSLYNGILNNINLNINHCYICCFSEKGDLLSQWRAYADDGRGVSIGFSIDDMEIDKKIPCYNVFKKHTIGIYNVIYDIEEQKRIVNEQLNLIFSKSSRDMISDTTCLSLYAKVLKNPFFREEKEWRIIHTPLITSDNKYGNIKIIGNISECNFRFTKFGMWPYFKWDFANKKKCPISEIIIGPQNMTTIDNVYLFMEQKKLKNITVKNSQGSYRS